MRRRNRPRPGPGPGRQSTPPRPRDPRPDGALPHVVLIAAGVGLYLTMLWMGMVVIGDGAVRSALMSGLIVAIAATGYLFTRPQGPPGGGR
jgi:hypothetical protein